MKRERGFAAIGALISAIPMSVWVGLAFGLVLSFSIFQTHRLHKEQKAFTQFQADVKAAGKAAEDAAVKKAAEDKKQKRKPMRKINALLTLSITSLCGCAQTTPLAVSCPPPPPPPAVLTSPVSTGPSLTERYERLLEELSRSLENAQRQP
jgi:hypothetical protein